MRDAMVRSPLALICVLALGFAPQTGKGQGFQYVTTTTVELPGNLGGLLNAAASLTGVNDLEETVSVLGDRMRVDKGSTSTITDLEWQTVTHLDHEEMTFRTETFDELAARIEAAKGQLDLADFAAEEAGIGIENAQDSQERSAPSQSSVDQNVVFDFNTEWSGEKKRIGRHGAEQAFFTLKASSSRTEDDSDELKGTFVALNDMWLAKEIDGYSVLESFQVKASEMMGVALFGKGGLEELQSIVLKDPRVDAMMESVREESQKIEGIPIAMDTYLVLVPEDQEFDRALVLQEDAPKKSKLRGLLSAARRSVRDGLTESNDSGQKTLVRISVKLSGFVSGDSVLPAYFDIPSEYTETGLD